MKWSLAVSIQTSGTVTPSLARDPIDGAGRSHALSDRATQKWSYLKPFRAAYLLETRST